MSQCRVAAGPRTGSVGSGGSEAPPGGLVRLGLLRLPRPPATAVLWPCKGGLGCGEQHTPPDGSGSPSAPLVGCQRAAAQATERAHGEIFLAIRARYRKQSFDPGILARKGFEGDAVQGG